MKLIFKFIYHILFLLIFGMSIAVQYNDPDPYFWILLYGLPIMLGILHLANRPVRLSAVGLSITYTIYAVWIYPGIIPNPLEDEEFREAGGLLICVAYLLSLAVASVDSNISRAQSEIV